MVGCYVTLCDSKWLRDVVDDAVTRTAKYYKVFTFVPPSTTRYYSLLQSITPYYKVPVEPHEAVAEVSRIGNV